VLISTAEARIVAVREQVATARLVVTSCRPVPWRSRAADEYRDAVDCVLRMLTQLTVALDSLVRLATTVRAAAGLPAGACARPWHAPSAVDLAPVTPSRLGATSVQVGSGGLTSVDTDALAQVAARLAAAARALDEAQGVLVGVADECAWTVAVAGRSGAASPATPEGLAVVGHGAALVGRGGFSPGRLADVVQRVAGAVRSAGVVAAAGESAAQAGMRDAATSAGALVGRAPVLLLAAPSMVAPFALGYLLAGGPDGASVSDLVAVGGVDAAVTAFAAGLRAALPGDAPFTLTPVRDSTALLAAVLARSSGTAITVPVDSPPQLPTPRGLAGVIDVVARTYDDGMPTGTPGTAPATITVQRLDHPDGTRSWLVAVPGTRSMGLAGDVPTDNGTNLRLAAGVMDDMTGGVLTAMQAAGIPPDELVVLAGHSQGGMVAMSAAAAVAGVYRLGGVVTAGSPNVPSSVPAGVPLVRLEHAEDAIPQLDGLPTRVGGNVTRITRTLDETGTGVSLAAAHQVDEYRRTAAMVDAGLADPASALGTAGAGAAPGVTALVAALGPEGTTATTMQFQVTRDLATATVDPTTGLPRVPVLRAEPG